MQKKSFDFFKSSHISKWLHVKIGSRLIVFHVDINVINNLFKYFLLCIYQFVDAQFFLTLGLNFKYTNIRKLYKTIGKWNILKYKDFKFIHKIFPLQKK